MEKGAASPGRWQVWQCFCNIGAASLVNVGGGLFGSCPSAYPAQHSVPASRMHKYFMNFPTSPFGPRLTRIGQNRANLQTGRESISGGQEKCPGSFFRISPMRIQLFSGDEDNFGIGARVRSGSTNNHATAPSNDKPAATKKDVVQPNREARKGVSDAVRAPPN